MKTNTLSVCAAVLAAAFSFIVPGTAHAVQGDPIPGIDVSIEQSPGGIIAKDTTDGTGSVTFKAIAPGTYIFRVKPPEMPVGTPGTRASNNYNSAKSNTGNIIIRAGGKTLFDKVVPYDYDNPYLTRIIIPAGPDQDIQVAVGLVSYGGLIYGWGYKFVEGTDAARAVADGGGGAAIDFQDHNSETGALVTETIAWVSATGAVKYKKVFGSSIQELVIYGVTPSNLTYLVVPNPAIPDNFKAYLVVVNPFGIETIVPKAMLAGEGATMGSDPTGFLILHPNADGITFNRVIFVQYKSQHGIPKQTGSL